MEATMAGALAPPPMAAIRTTAARVAARLAERRIRLLARGF